MPDPSEMLGSFVWYDEMANDAVASGAFYASVVGWSLQPNRMNDQPYTLLQADAEMVGGLMPIPAEAKGAAPAWMGYIAVDDVNAYADKVKAAGGAINRTETEIPNVGTFAVASDPFGGAFLLFRGGGGDGGYKLNDAAPGHVGWRELHAGDGAKALDFYSAVFGWKAEDALDMGPMGKYHLFTTKSGQPGGIMTKTADTPKPIWLYYFNIESVEAGAERVKAGGGKVLNGPMEVPGGHWTVQALDPQGALFGLVSPKR